MASDSEAMYAQGASPTIGQQQVTKIHQIGDSMLYTATGAVGMSQIILNALPKLTQGPLTRPDVVSSTDAMLLISQKISGEVKRLAESASALVPLVGGREAGMTVLSKSLVGVAFRSKCCLFQFDYSGAPEEATKELPFVSLGAGQNIADPFLALLKRILWKDREPSVPEGRFVAAWTIKHVSETIPGGVGLPLQMASLSIEGGRPKIEFIDRPEEHVQAVEGAEAALRDHIRRGGVEEIPDVPKPSG